MSVTTQTSKTYNYSELLTLLASLGYSRGEAMGIADYAIKGTLTNLIIDANDRLFNVTAEAGITSHVYTVTAQ